jgi:hypothetical protein
MEPNPIGKDKGKGRGRRNEESPLYIKGLFLKCGNFVYYLILNV